MKQLQDKESVEVQTRESNFSPSGETSKQPRLKKEWAKQPPVIKELPNF